MIGKKLAHYQIIEKLGEGGMGQVYRAKDTRLGREVAIKVLPADTAGEPERLRRFQREARAVAALNHPNIVTVHSVEEANGVRFITMELVEGQSLSQRIRAAGLPVTELLELALPLADAVSAAHQQGITHRDLKPDNILVGDDGRLKVLDFGLAKLREEPLGEDATELPTATMTQEGRILGTVSYMSPEQAEGKPVGPRSDVFSLGIILYEMVTGERPFKGETALSILSAILKDTPIPVTELKRDTPRQLADIIGRCLAKEPEERFRSAVELREELTALQRKLSSGDVMTQGSGVGTKSRRERWVLPLVVVMAVVGVMFVFGPRLLDGVLDRSRTELAGTHLGSKQRIVVLPFENLGPPEDAYFAAGMTEEITSRLAAVAGLGVISRTSAVLYEGSGKTIRQIGEELDVDFVLEGTVRWDHGPAAESRVRITPQLIRVADNTHVWSNSYDRILADIFGVQSDIAERVVQELDVALSGAELARLKSRPTDDLVAYQFYLRGLRHMTFSHGPEDGYREAVRMFQRAVEKDPQFTLAYVQLSAAHRSLYFFGYERTDARLAMAREAVQRAQQLDPGLPAVHLALGDYYYHGLLDYDRALEELSIAAKGLPNDHQMLTHVAWIWRREGLLEQAIENLELARSLNPRDGSLVTELAYTYLLVRDYERALRICDESLEITPSQKWGYVVKVQVQRFGEGDLDGARATLEAMPDRSSSYAAIIWIQQEFLERNFPAALERIDALDTEALRLQSAFIPRDLLAGFVYRDLDQPEQARSRFDAARRLLEREKEERPDDPRVRSALGLAHAGLGQKEKAIREGRRAVELYPISKDALLGVEREWDLARVYVMIGEYDLAVERLEYLLSIPSSVTVARLRLEPLLDPLRDHPEFGRLVDR